MRPGLLFFLLLPTTIAVDSSGNSILKLATIPIAAFFVGSLFLSGRKMHLNLVHFALILFSLSTLFSLFVDSSADAIQHVMGYFLNAAIYTCLSVVAYNDRELSFFEDVQIVLLLILNIMTLFASGMEDDRTTLMIMGQTSDPNFFVGFFIFPLTVALKRIAESRFRLLYLALVCVSIYSILLSGSRGGLLSTIITIVSFALLYPKSLRKSLLILSAGLLAMFLLIVAVFPLLPENVAQRMSIDAVVETGGTGRTTIWKSMLTEIYQMPGKLFFGRGLTAIHRMFISGKWGGVYAHNQMIQLLYNQGIFGVITFLLLVTISFFRCCKRRTIVSIALIGMLTLSISLSFNQTTRSFWNLIPYAAFAFPEPSKPPG